MRALLAALLCLLMTAAEAAVVRLKDGSTLRGTVVGATARDLQLHTESGTLTIAVDRIERIDFAESPPPAPTAEEEGVRTGAYRPDWTGRRPIPEEDRSQEFALDAGLAVPIGRISFAEIGGGSTRNGGAGVLLGLHYLVLVSERTGLGFAFDYAARGTGDGRGLVQNASTDVYGDTLLFLFQAKRTLTSRGAARPYLLAGLGAHRTSTRVDAEPLFGFAWSDTSTTESRRLIDDDVWGGAFSLRFGVDFRYARESEAAFEAGWTGIPKATYGATPDGEALGLTSVKAGLQLLTIGGRWGWRF